MTTTRPRHPLKDALKIANLIRFSLAPFCERIEIVGSVRRRRPSVKDIEILYIPKFRLKSADLFSSKASTMEDLSAAELEKWLQGGIIGYRLNENACRTWGDLNKYAVHCETEMPMDFFATTEEKWWNAIVCRTGGEQFNKQLCSAALKRGWSFNAYGSGFTSLRGLPPHQTTSERDVIEFAGLEYLEPENRP